MRWRKHSGHKLLSIVLILVLALVATGCGNQQTSGSGGDSKDIKIGVLLPLTGALAKIGENNKNGYELAVKEINEKGGIKALGGAKLKLVYGDSQGKPDVGVSETERLIQNEKVALVTGAFQSNVTIPTTQVAERLQTVYLNPVAIADSITNRGFKYTFQINAKASWFARDQVNFLDYVAKVTNKKPQKVALLYENTDFGQSTAAGQKKYLAEKGYDIVADVSYPAGAADLTTELSKIKVANPDVVLQVSYIADAILIAKTKDRLGIKVPFVDSAGGSADPAFIQSVKELANGWFTINQFNKDLPGAKELNDKFKAAYGTDMNGHAALDYQAMFVLKEVLEKQASVDKEAIRKGLSEIQMGAGPSLIMPYEKLIFDSTGQASSSLIITQIQNGEHVTVWPEKFATVKPNFYN